jgi:hypothetical protein
LSISGFEAYTGSAPVTTETTEEEESFEVEGEAKKISLRDPSMNKPYSKNAYLPTWALSSSGNKTSITARGVGNWWKASFVGGEQLVERVRVKNRHDCCGDRIAGTKITVDGELCGTLPKGSNG